MLWRDPFCVMVKCHDFSVFKMATVCVWWLTVILDFIFEIEIFNSHALHAKFCGDRSYCCRDIAIFRAFLVNVTIY